MSTFRLMSFNIRGAIIADGDNIWPARANLNCETITKYSPDLIGFQELQTGNWETYEECLPEYGRILGPEYNNEDPFCYPSIFYNPAKFKAVENGGFWLSETPDLFSSDWDTRCIRSALWVRFAFTEVPGKTVLFLNTHLDHVSEKARIMGAKLITERLSRIHKDDEPVIISGDFNCKPNTDAYNAFLNSAYDDTYISTGNIDNGEVNTFHGFKGESYGGHTRMDWILLNPGNSNIKALEAKIIYDSDPPLYPSDHYPVITDFMSDPHIV